MSRNRKVLTVMMRTPMTAAANRNQQLVSNQPFSPPNDASLALHNIQESSPPPRDALAVVKERMRASIIIPTDKIESVDANLEEFSKGYTSLPEEHRRELLLVLAKEYDVNRNRVRELVQQYLSLEFPDDSEGNVPEDEQSGGGVADEAFLASCYRMERNLRIALKPMYGDFFERLNAYPGGLKILAVLRADLLKVMEFIKYSDVMKFEKGWSTKDQYVVVLDMKMHTIIQNEICLKHMPIFLHRNEVMSSLRALDSYLKEKLITWLSPATLHLHQITWDDPASLLEKIVVYEAVHPIRSLQDLRRRLSIGRRCFGYFHPAIPGEPLIFIEVALLKAVAKTIQEILWDNPPFPESDATCALFYSISSTQAGLSGINLGKFLIKRVIELVRRDMPNIMVFATLSPIPGYMQWLLSKLASQLKFAEVETKDNTNSSGVDYSSTFRENLLLLEEQEIICESGKVLTNCKSGIEILYKLLSSTDSNWSKSDHLLSALKPPLMRLCARYLLKEKKRGKALDPVANFHLQNGAIIERLNWMADPSEKGIRQSAGIMVNYVYRLEQIEENAQSYFSIGHIRASADIHCCFEGHALQL